MSDAKDKPGKKSLSTKLFSSMGRLLLCISLITNQAFAQLDQAVSTYYHHSKIRWGIKVGLNASGQTMYNIPVVSHLAKPFINDTIVNNFGTDNCKRVLLKIYQELSISRRFTLHWGIGFRQQGLRTDHYYDPVKKVIRPLLQGKKETERFDNLYADLAVRYYFSKRQRRPLYLIAGNRLDRTIHRKKGFWRHYDGIFLDMELSVFAGAGLEFPLKKALVRSKKSSVGHLSSMVFVEMDYNLGLMPFEKPQLAGISVGLNQPAPIVPVRNTPIIRNYSYSITTGLRF